MNISSKEHFGTIVKYIGISFITGGISHGFFSGTRSIITIIVGVLLFIYGHSLLEKKESLIQAYFYYGMLAIGLGCLTGGLQHFPDSPERSLIIVPIGFALTCLFFIYSEGKKWSTVYKKYSIIGTIITTILSIGLFFGFENGYIPKGEIHRHNEANSNIQYDGVNSNGTGILEKIPGDPNDGHTEHSH